MLFILTGDVQTGKTRWLQSLIADLSAYDVMIAGVIAPGVWRERDAGEKSGKRGLSGEGRFEKLGIDNILLPDNRRISFARRSDLARVEGSYDATSQSATAQLAWEISEEALACVNAHFEALQAQVKVTMCKQKGLVVVDEFGRLELLYNGGLTAALNMIEAGPTPAFPHALIIVREQLLNVASERFAPIWGNINIIEPHDRARDIIYSAFELKAGEQLNISCHNGCLTDDNSLAIGVDYD